MLSEYSPSPPSPARSHTNSPRTAERRPSPSPPWPAEKNRCPQDQVQKRRPRNRLLKETSPDLPPTPSFHHESLAESTSSDRPMPRRSTSSTSLQKKGNTALLGKMPISILLPSHSSGRRSQAARMMKKRMLQIRPMGSRNLLPYSTKERSTQELILILLPASSLCTLRPATPARAAPVWPGGAEDRTRRGRF